MPLKDFPFALGNISKINFHTIHTGDSFTLTGCQSDCDGAPWGPHPLGDKEGGLGSQSGWSKGRGDQAWRWVYAQSVAVALCQVLEDFLPAVSPHAPSPVDGG